ncbi:hypothetical protein [Streptacidiphilus fuscans]|uniref:Uncharacterized protein n=1 Tax=Streptacidiphilus fuscans TaxID=2789292 RepID=A0A931B6T5_9ACTN|nr:hypothetical protein [Streptacidiphilus fuscans]MBF9069702.1 hypothetical protein [Streptacidiphilus fuscans]
MARALSLDPSSTTENTQTASGRTAADVVAAPGHDWASSLVHTAVANRPVEEVAQLFAILDSAGEMGSPSPACAIAAGRPLEDVSRLLASLDGAQQARGHEILCAAVVHRPIADVAFLVGSLADGPAVAAVESALRIAAVHRSLDDVVALARALKVDKAPADTVKPEGKADARTEGRAKVEANAKTAAPAEDSGRRGFLGGKRG